MVYELYGLTDEEIRIVEEATASCHSNCDSHDDGELQFSHTSARLRNSRPSRRSLDNPQRRWLPFARQVQRATVGGIADRFTLLAFRHLDHLRLTLERV